MTIHGAQKERTTPAKPVILTLTVNGVKGKRKDPSLPSNPLSSRAFPPAMFIHERKGNERSVAQKAPIVDLRKATFSPILTS